MIDAALSAAFEATWPPAETVQAGGFAVGRGMGGGGRVASARRVGDDWSPADIDAAVEIQRGWDQTPQFRVADEETGLAAALEQRGFQRHNPTVTLVAPVNALTDQAVPPVTAFAVWPPMAIQRDIWTAGGIGPARQAVMMRAPDPRSALLGRIKDRAAGAGFVAVHGDVAMVHGLTILPEWRRLGLAGWMMRKAAFWATDQGATRLGLAVSRGNTAAVALYSGLGMTEAGGYAYYAAPEPGAA